MLGEDDDIGCLIIVSCIGKFVLEKNVFSSG